MLPEDRVGVDPKVVRLRRSFEPGGHPDLQTRLKYDQVDALAEDIRAHGQLQPGRAVEKPDGTGYWIYMGIIPHPMDSSSSLFFAFIFRSAVAQY